MLRIVRRTDMLGRASVFHSDPRLHGAFEPSGARFPSPGWQLQAHKQQQRTNT